MNRLLASPSLAATLAARRDALAALQRLLNSQAAAKLDGLMRAAEGKAKHAGTQPPLRRATG